MPTRWDNVTWACRPRDAEGERVGINAVVSIMRKMTHNRPDMVRCARPAPLMNEFLT